MIKRIIFDIVFLVALFAMPWWLTVIVGVLGLILFRNFWEIILAGLIIDSFYSIPGAQIIGRFGFFTISSLLLFIIFSFIKNKMRFFA
ncbi:hypothetical protein KJ763_00805 [Patescibacteria group bacterium]|nr:hypothetical protein [Patescibacteria group bacterium]